MVTDALLNYSPWRMDLAIPVEFDIDIPVPALAIDIVTIS